MEDNKGPKKESNRRRGFVRRSYSYAYHIPERRRHDDRRSSNDGSSELADQVSPEESEEKRP